MKMKFFKKALAFTLAEVLITLSILGVVAAITVPSLIKRQHRNEYETKLKKAISMIETVISVSEAEHGKSLSQWDPNITLTAAEFNKEYIRPYLNIAKECNTDEKECAYPYYNPKTGEVHPYGNPYNPRYILKDGTSVAVGHDSNIFFNWVIDLNGKKAPNVQGKDIYRIFISADSKSGSYYINSKFYSWKSTRAQWLNSCKDDGQFCFELFYNNKLKFPDDYPWL